MDFNYAYNPFRPKPRRWGRRILLVIASAFSLWLLGSALFGWGGGTLKVVNNLAFIGGEDSPPTPTPIPISEDPEYEMPANDKSRIDILVLGIRGEDDTENGGLLTDTILLFSLNPDTGAATLTSIPRDLTVRVTDEHVGKVNEIYTYYGLNGTKRMFSRILGISIDNIAVIDFNAFESIVETLGGVTVTLEQPFSEKDQWGYEFSLPVGPNELNGEQALYYVRSRYGSSDFDRSRRQMQVILAIREKLGNLNLLSDPLKALSIVTTIKSHLKSDLDIFDLGTIRTLITQGSDLASIHRYQLTPDNLLYEAKINGIYELLPKGDTLAHIKAYMGTILTGNPVIWSPTPTPATP